MRTHLILLFFYFNIIINLVNGPHRDRILAVVGSTNAKGLVTRSFAQRDALLIATLGQQRVWQNNKCRRNVRGQRRREIKPRKRKLLVFLHFFLLLLFFFCLFVITCNKKLVRRDNNSRSYTHTFYLGKFCLSHSCSLLNCGIYPLLPSREAAEERERCLLPPIRRCAQFYSEKCHYSSPVKQGKEKERKRYIIVVR